MKNLCLRTLLLVLFTLGAIFAHAQHKPQAKFSGNPILPGNFADPCILVYRDTVYIYATHSNMATVWRSADMVNWKLTKINWPSSMKLPDVWAPAVRQGTDGKFYFYTSTNHQIYAGVASHPAGPFTNILGADSVFIKDRQYWHKIHTIDADCFVDDDGQAYLYWGSGWDFKDGICAVGILGNDMASFKESPKDITPGGYFEGPHMLKHNNKYYLMYSDGLYYDSSYKVRYAIGDKPTGPFMQATNSPVLISDAAKHVSGPGHHYTIKLNGQYYIVYHKHVYPYYKGIRQVCIDKMDFDANGNIKPIVPTDTGVELNILKSTNTCIALTPVKVEASATISAEYGAVKAFDNHNETLWAAPADKPAWIKADLGKVTNLGWCQPVFDDVMAGYQYIIEYSVNGNDWKPYAQGNNSDASEWPVTHAKPVKARYVKLTITKALDKTERIGLWEFKLYR
ncbi:MAG: hypothetical protein EOP47_15900 [Sphingobacteriaceae bacterium]|nr:MAG: hypothetical protein EOP47_15900 [Sphingobacteriaceae bacterium]